MNPIIRPAQLSDAEAILNIRNEPASLAVAANQEPIPLDKHIAWFKNKYLSDKGSVCFVAELDGRVIGYSRFDLEDNYYLYSIAVSSFIHGKGIGTILLNESIKLLKTTIPILAEVRKHNIASIKLLDKCGFKRIFEPKDNIYFKYEIYKK